MSFIDDKYKRYLNDLVLLAVALGCVCVTLASNNAFYDMLETKARTFRVAMTYLLPMVMLAGLISYDWLKPKLSDLPFWLIGVSGGLSTLLSFSPPKAWTGNQGWYVGGFVIISLSFMILVLKNLEYDQLVFKTAYIIIWSGATVTMLLIVLEAARIDLTGFHKDVIDLSYYHFFSTLGNANWVTGFVCIYCAYFAISFMIYEEKMMLVPYLICSALGLFAVLVIGSDGAVLGLGVCAIAMTPYIFRDTKRVKNLGILIFTVGVELLVLGGSRFSPLVSDLLHGGCIVMYLLKTPIKILVLLAGALLVTAGYLLKPSFYDKYSRFVIAVLELILLMILTLGVYLIFFHTELTIESGRTLIWSESLAAYKKMPFTVKLFGTGPEMLRNVYAHLSGMMGVIYNTSHSEPVQMLLTMGAVGLAVWIYFWGMFANVLFDLERRGMEALPCLASMFAYLGQSFVNSATLPNLLLMSLLVVQLCKKLYDI